jgi:hypothetical protein
LTPRRCRMLVSTLWASSRTRPFLFGQWCVLFLVWPSLTYTVYVSLFGVVVEPKEAVMAQAGAYILAAGSGGCKADDFLPAGGRGQE